MKKKARTLLIVEDDVGLQKQLKWCFEDCDVHFAEDKQTALAHLRRYEPEVVLQDLGLPPDPEGVGEGFATLQEILQLCPHTKVIVVTGNDDIDNAVKAVGQGACDFYQKPVDTDVLNIIVNRAFHIHRLEVENRKLLENSGASPLEGLIATSDEMIRVCRNIEKLAPTSVTTLLLGESGTGKELLARAIHRLSPRSDKPFVAINCAAIPEQLLESELFGHEKGAFTGAVKRTLGKLELADGGTILLDEIGDMPLALQAKMLRFLQDFKLERVGGREEIQVDVRMLSATNQDLKGLIEEGSFREDLYYRISEVTVKIPPLRERDGDQVALASVLLRKYCEKQGRTMRGFSGDGLAAIQNYSWPGNVRELENKIKGAVIMAEGNQITAADLELKTDGNGPVTLNLREVRSRAEKQAVRRALVLTGNNIAKASEHLGITRPTLYDLIDKHDISQQE